MQDLSLDQGRSQSSTSEALIEPRPPGWMQVVIRNADVVLALAAAMNAMPLTTKLRFRRHRQTVRTVGQAAMVLRVMLPASHGIDTLYQDLVGIFLPSCEGAMADANLVFSTVMRSIIWGTSMVLILRNLGFNVDTVITGIGISGLTLG